MAECQTPFSYAPPVEGGLIAALSTPRFNTYLTASGYNTSAAFQLYLYNARLSKALLYPLHALEVVVRNSVHSMLEARYGAAWDRSQAFQTILTTESSQALQKAHTRAANRGRQSTADVVAHLTLDFWSNLFRDHYDRSLWQTGFPVAFPNAFAVKATRATFQPVIARLNHLRNRIAHYEPIFKEPISQRYSEILDGIQLCSSSAASWVRAHSTVHLAMRSKPKGGSVGPTVGERCDRSFGVVDVNKKLFPPLNPLPACGAVVVQNGKETVGVLGIDSIGAYLTRAAVNAGGMIDLSDHTYGDVLKQMAGCEFAYVSDDAPLSSLISVFKGDIRFAVSTDASGSASGLVLRAHRRY